MIKAAKVTRTNPITTVTTTACCSKHIAHLGREQEKKCSRRKFHHVMLFGDLCKVDLCFWIGQIFCESNALLFQDFWWSVALYRYLENMVLFDLETNCYSEVLIFWIFGLDHFDLFLSILSVLILICLALLR